MKRISIVVLVLFFLIANSGWAITIHTCGNKLAAVSFFVPNKHPCKCSVKIMKPNCCRQKTGILKANHELGKISTLQIKAPQFFVILLPFINSGLLSAVLSKQYFLLFCSSPPLATFGSFVTLFKVFRI